MVFMIKPREKKHVFKSTYLSQADTLKRKRTERERRVGLRPALREALCLVLLCFVLLGWLLSPAVFSREVEREWIQGRERGAAARSGGRGYCGLGVLCKGRIYLQKAYVSSRGPICSLVRRT